MWRSPAPLPILVLALAAGLLTARQAAAVDDFPGALPNGDVYSCQMCHAGDGSFPEDFVGAGSAWSRSLALLDSDGDGFANGWELQDLGCLDAEELCWKFGDPQPGSVDLVSNPNDLTDFVPEPSAGSLRAASLLCLALLSRLWGMHGNGSRRDGSRRCRARLGRLGRTR